MALFINDISLLTSEGLDTQGSRFLLRGETIDNLSDYDVLKVKGLRKVPREYKAFYVLLDRVLKKNGFKAYDPVGLIDSYEVSNLSSNVEFESQIKTFGKELTDPLLSAYTIGNSCSGWLAIMTKLNTLNLTVNSGKCSVAGSMNVAKNSLLQNDIESCVILSGSYSVNKHDIFSKYELHLDKLHSEYCSSILVSKDKNDGTRYEVTDIVNKCWNSPEQIQDFCAATSEDITIIESNYDCSDMNIKGTFVAPEYANALQHSVFSCILSDKNELGELVGAEIKEGTKINYIIIDKSGTISLIKLKSYGVL